MHLFLSPHYDDAVFSCGGTIYQLTQGGATVRVYTVMGGAAEATPTTPLVRELHERWRAGDDPVQTRRAEDRDAVYALNAEVAYNAALADGIYRVASADGVALYPAIDDLFAGVHPDDPAVAHLEFKVFTSTTLWRNLQFDEGGNYTFADEESATLYAPLTIGNHVDHQIVRDWALKLRQIHQHLTLTFYEDFPYARDPDAIDAALAAFPVPLRQERVYLTDAAVQAKIQSMVLYRSQITSFWPNTAALAEDVERTLRARGEGRPAENFYVIAGR